MAAAAASAVRAVRAVRFCRSAARTVSLLSAGHWGNTSPLQTRSYVLTTAVKDAKFKLDEKTAHSSLDLFKRDTGVIYRVLGLDPSQVQDNPERFRDWAVVFGDEKISGGQHYWEVTVKKSQEFRIGVAEALMSRDECVGTSSSSWVFGYAQRKWFAMMNNKVVPVTLFGKPDRVGVLLDYERGVLSLVNTEKSSVVHSIKASFKGALCPAFALWDGELLTHSGLETPEGLK